MVSFFSGIRTKKSRRLRTHFDILPDEIIHEILCRLPLGKVLQVQSVCRSWHAMVSSSRIFQKLWQQRHSENWLIMDRCDSGVVWLFNTNKNKWLKKKILSDPSAGWRLIDAAGGLLLYKNDFDGMLKVVNPLTLRSRQLCDPAVGQKFLSFYIKKGSSFLVSIVVDSTSGTYKIVVLGLFGGNREFLIYTSAQLSWKRILGDDDLEEVTSATWMLYKTASNERVYCLSLNNQPQDSYTLVSGMMSGKITRASDNIVDWGLVVCNGRNIRLAHCWGVVGRILQIIFELDEVTGRWNISSVGRRGSVCECEPNYVPFGELLYETEFVVSCGGGGGDFIWIMPAESEKDAEDIRLLLRQQQKHNFNGYNYQNSTAFPMPLRFWPCP